MELILDITLASAQLAVVNQPLVLAVDDDEDNLLLLAEVVKDMDCLCITATSGRTALFLAQVYLPHLILLDIMLPDIHGIEIINRLRQNQNTHTIPLVAVTALASATDKERILLAGCNDYISKPYMLDELEAKINRHLGSVVSCS